MRSSGHKEAVPYKKPKYLGKVKRTAVTGEDVEVGEIRVGTPHSRADGLLGETVLGPPFFPFLDKRKDLTEPQM